MFISITDPRREGRKNLPSSPFQNGGGGYGRKYTNIGFICNHILTIHGNLSLTSIFTPSSQAADFRTITRKLCQNAAELAFFFCS